MNSKSLRRLAADHGSLHTAGLPPNYLFPPSADPSSDLTSLDVLLAGPTGTPYSQGVWRLHLDIPPTYPTAPPTATFRTRLWHPNIDEATGAVCVETLKRDWSSTLKLRDVLVTISCLLIQPNPASALNEAAGKLASEDWDGFCRRAKLMTGIHAGVPRELEDGVKEAQMRGEDKVEKPEEKVQEKKDVNSKGKGKERVIATPSPVSRRKSKLRQASAAEDEENRRRRGDTAEPGSDSESEWIPGPAKSPKPFAPSRDNIFGIKGLDESMQIDSPIKLTSTNPASSAPLEPDDKSDPFITIPTTKRHPLEPTSFNIPSLPSSHPFHLQHSAPDSNSATPDLLKFSSRNPYSAIQPNNQQPPLHKEFSWSWTESEILYSTGTIKDGETKGEVRKRMAGEEFGIKQKWEAKRFKKAGASLERYNRGDFGPRIGLGRL